MPDSFQTARSILWMIQQVKRRGQFLYDDWAAEFRPGQPPIPSRRDRTFHNHLALFRDEALELFGEIRDFELKSDNGRYFIERAVNETKFDKVTDAAAYDFLPLLHALNGHRSLLPFAAPGIERLLVDGLDLPEGSLGHIVYKTSSPWRYQADFLQVFLDALVSRTKLFVTPEGDRVPCSVTPLFLVNFDGAWYLLGLRGNLLQYNLSRVVSLEATDEPAETVSVKKLEQLRRLVETTYGSFFVTDWEELTKGEPVTIRYTGMAARYARERFDPASRQEHDLWFETKDAGDIVEVTVNTLGFEEVIAEVRRWGTDAEAVNPVEFRERWLEERGVPERKP